MRLSYTFFLPFFALLFASQHLGAQAANPDLFQGKVVYDYQYVGTGTEMSTEDAKIFLGNECTVYYKPGMYKSVLNGTMQMTKYYLGGDTLFTYIGDLSGLAWETVLSSNDMIEDYIFTDAAETICGMSCTKMSLNTATGHIDYYFNEALPAREQDFSKHSLGLFKYCLHYAGAFPLKTVITTKESVITMTAKKVERAQIADAEFVLPELERLKPADSAE